jgi:hypothetical protein
MRLEQRQPASVRWAWSLNAAASVMGSAGAIMCSIYFGLIQTLLIGGGLYLVALMWLQSSFAGTGCKLRQGGCEPACRMGFLPYRSRICAAPCLEQPSAQLAAPICSASLTGPSAVSRNPTARHRW